MTRSPDKGRPARMTLADLRADAIDCIACDLKKPAAGSLKFHACHVCAECATKLQAQTKQNRQGATT
ncbi:hypothetical protein AVMA1855_16750 [Acidovorax sp. SUPP1855]|uniref:hypothetical protein n=1 Tax=Acidovorax sp. SUPP1855 TaxID=431774 RepID=UPI0023DE1E8F|nr:hypothetical protein [Acidovorax sp. SUPP1855]GKS85824.1 hypothetical protein AVMA1855_16750 [Acidovorax sp. SUPP1855]